MCETATAREAMIPKAFGDVEKQLDRLSDLTHRLIERLDTLTRPRDTEKAPQPERPSSGVQIVDRLTRISGGVETIGDGLQSLIDRLEI